MSANLAILLCTYNGEPFLSAQLDSLAAQTFKNWRVWASDDGSSDGTLAILQQYQTQWGVDRLTILHGPRNGPAANFMSLVHNEQIEADYVAYCDQDDIWEPDKLARAVQALDAIQARSGSGCPALYGSRTRYIDEDGHELALSGLFARPPGFGNALVQCIAGGNTMVYNRAARALLTRVAPGQAIVMHDWWTYIVTTACGGQVVFDPYPSVRYRQHSANERGMNRSLMGRLHRVWGLLDGRFRTWNQINSTALLQLDAQMTPQARHQMARFSAARNSSLFGRIVAFFKSGIYRQSVMDDVALAAMAVLRRL